MSERITLAVLMVTSTAYAVWLAASPFNKWMLIPLAPTAVIILWRIHHPDAFFRRIAYIALTTCIFSGVIPTIRLSFKGHGVLGAYYQEPGSVAVSVVALIVTLVYGYLELRRRNTSSSSSAPTPSEGNTLTINANTIQGSNIAAGDQHINIGMQRLSLSGRQISLLIATLVIVAVVCTLVYSMLSGDNAQTKGVVLQRHAGVLIPRTLLSGEHRKFPQLEIGDSGTILSLESEAGIARFDKFLDLFVDTDLTIKQSNTKALVSLRIYDKQGALIAEIIDNEWKVNPSLAWDRNFSVDALEVKDPAGEVILQVRILADRIQLQARLYDSAGRGAAIYKTEDGRGGIMLDSHSEWPRVSIRPMFVYPSDLHLGQLAPESR